MFIALKKTGITLIEVVIALAITSVIGLGVVSFQKNSTGIATSGISNINIMRQAEMALKIIHNDLKHVCIPYKEKFSISFNDMIQVDFSEFRGLDGAEFSFFRMPYESKFVSNIDDEHYRLRPLVQIKYSLQKAKDSELLQLVRYEIDNSQKVTSKIIAEKVSSFNITTESIKTETSEKWFWKVSLSLSQKSDKTSSMRGEHSLDFYDVVFPEFYKAIADNPHSVRNWNTGFTFINKQ